MYSVDTIKRVRMLAMALGLFMTYIFVMYGLYLITKDSVISAFISDIFMILLGGSYIIFRNKGFPKNYKYDKRFFFFVVVAILILWFLSQIVATYMISNGAIFDDVLKYVNKHPVLYIVMAILIAPICEEILMRGIVFHELYHQFSRFSAYFISSVVFGIMHGTVVQVVLGILCGILFAFIYEYTHKLRYSIYAHIGFNLLSIMLAMHEIPIIEEYANPTGIAFVGVVLAIFLAVMGNLFQSRLPYGNDILS